MPRPRRTSSSVLEPIMKSAENKQQHIARIPRPHVAHEYRDRGGDDVAETLCYKLTAHARMCAKGEARPHIRARVKA